MRRRRDWLVTTLAVAWCRAMGQPAARAAGSGRMPVIGVIHPGRPQDAEPGHALDRFRHALRELGLVEGVHLSVEVMWDEYNPARLPVLSAALAAMPAAVIVTGTTGAAMAARRATNSVPIVMAVSADPVADGLVHSMARPGGNVTGLSLMSPELDARRLQMLGELLPGQTRFALLSDPANPRMQIELQSYRQAAQSQGLELLALSGGDAALAAESMRAARRGGATGLVIAASPRHFAQRAPLAALALSHRLASIAAFGDGEFARAGGLMSYGANIAANWERAAWYVKRILDGARPADLPVEPPRRMELHLNLRTADTLGLKVPAHLLLMADELVR